MSAARTPGPWAVIGVNIYGGRQGLVRDTVANTTCAGSMTRTEDEANASFIVEACNAYETLRAENAKLREALAAILTCDRCRPGGECACPYCSSHEVARAALGGGITPLGCVTGKGVNCLCIVCVPAGNCECPKCHSPEKANRFFGFAAGDSIGADGCGHAWHKSDGAK